MHLRTTSHLEVPIVSYDWLGRSPQGQPSHGWISVYGKKKTKGWLAGDGRLNLLPDSGKVLPQVRGGFEYKGVNTPLTLDYGGYTFENVKIETKYENLDVYRTNLYARLTALEAIKDRQELRNTVLDFGFFLIGFFLPEIALLKVFKFASKATPALFAVLDRKIGTFAFQEIMSECINAGLEKLVFVDAPSAVVSFSKSKTFEAAKDKTSEAFVEFLIGESGSTVDAIEGVRAELLALHVFQVRSDPAYASLFVAYMEANNARIAAMRELTLKR